MSLQYHLKLAPGDVAPYVLLPGDPGRAARRLVMGRGQGG